MSAKQLWSVDHPTDGRTYFSKKEQAKDYRRANKITDVPILPGPDHYKFKGTKP